MPKLKKPTEHQVTTEASAFLGGLFTEFKEQTEKYQDLTAELFSLQAQIELAEKTLCLTRDHLAMVIDRTECYAPKNWDQVLQTVQFVGVRLADACSALLRKHKRLTPTQFLSGLNQGMFRFRTNSPLREIHAALLRQSFAKKDGDAYVWIGKAEKQMPLRMRVIKAPMLSQGVEK